MAPLLLLTATMAVAGLGEPLSAMDAGTQKVWKLGSPLQAAGRGVSVFQMQTESGGLFHQYVDASGRVFAVSWRAQMKPDLGALLGRSYPAYAQATRKLASAPGHRRWHRLDDLDLVVQSESHLQVFSGYAYLRSMLPDGFSLAQLAAQ